MRGGTCTAVHWCLLCIVYSWMLARNRQAGKKGGHSLLLYYIFCCSFLHGCIHICFVMASSRPPLPRCSMCPGARDVVHTLIFNKWRTKGTSRSSI